MVSLCDFNVSPRPLDLGIEDQGLTISIFKNWHIWYQINVMAASGQEKGKKY